MKVQARLKNLRIAPRKVRLVTHSLIGIDTREALIQLEKLAKKSAEPVAKLVKSAIANATNNFGLDENNLYIQEISVGDGMRLERWLPRAFGRATPLVRRSSHLRVTLEERTPGKNRVTPKVKIEKKPESPEPVIQEAEIEEKAEKMEQDKKSIVPASSSAHKDFGKSGAKTGNQGKVVKKTFQRKAT